MKKRILYAVVAGMMLLTATGCGSDKDDSGSSSSSREESVKEDDKDDVDEEETDSEDDEDVIMMPTTFVNNTGVDIYYLYASVTDTDDWEEDILEEDLLEPSDYAMVNFWYAPDETVWDFAIEDSEGNMLEFYDIDFSDYDDSEGVTIYLNDDGTADIVEGADDYAE